MSDKANRGEEKLLRESKNLRGSGLKTDPEPTDTEISKLYSVGLSLIICTVHISFLIKWPAELTSESM